MAQAIAQRSRADWHLGGLLSVAFGHGLTDFFSGTVPLTIFFVVSNAHMSAWYQGIIGFAWYLTSSIVQPLFGAYTDRHGRWWFMPTGVLLVVVSISLAASASSIWLLTLLVTLGGCGASIMHPEAGKYAAMLSGSRRSQGISIFQMGGSLGFALGPVGIAALLARYGPSGSLALMIPGVIGVGILYVAMYRAHSAATEAHAERKRAADAITTKPDVFGITLVVASTTIRFLTTTAFITYLPNLLTARGGSLVDAGQLVTAFLLVGLIGMYLGGYLADRIGSVLVSVLALCLAVPALIGFFYAPMPIAIVFLLLGNVLLTTQNAPSVVIVQTLLPKSLGMALGLINGVAFGAGSALVTLVGFVVARYGAQPALLAVSVMPLIAASSFTIVNRRMGGVLRERKEAAALA